MASTSVRWDVVERVAELLENHPNIGAAKVHTVWPGDRGVTPEMVVADLIEGVSEPSSFMPARHHREDRFTVSWQIAVMSQKADPRGSMTRLFEVCAAFEDVCADSPTLGDLDGVVSCDVTNVRQWPVSTPEGSISGGEVVLSVHSYLE